jgi:hypothetical protein
MGLSPSSRPSECCLARIKAILDAIPPGRSETRIPESEVKVPNPEFEQADGAESLTGLVVTV